MPEENMPCVVTIARGKTVPAANQTPNVKTARVLYVIPNRNSIYLDIYGSLSGSAQNTETEYD
jgi:hypothetical protein